MYAMRSVSLAWMWTSSVMVAAFSRSANIGRIVAACSGPPASSFFWNSRNRRRRAETVFEVAIDVRGDIGFDVPHQLGRDVEPEHLSGPVAIRLAVERVRLTGGIERNPLLMIRHLAAAYPAWQSPVPCFDPIILAQAESAHLL